MKSPVTERFNDLTWDKEKWDQEKWDIYHYVKINIFQTSKTYDEAHNRVKNLVEALKI